MILAAIDPLVVIAATGPIVAIALAVYTSNAARKAALEARGAVADATAGLSRVGQAVEAVHHEIRPPSNGTTAGAYQEFVAGWIPWLYEELLSISLRLGLTPHAPPPTLAKVKPPHRPDGKK